MTNVPNRPEQARVPADEPATVLPPDDVETAPAEPEPAEEEEPSFTVGQVVNLSGDAGRRLGVVVGVTPATDDAPESYEVAELAPPSGRRFVADDLSPA